MQSITLSEEQREFRAVMRQFAEREIAPRATEIDRRGEFDWEAYKACVAMDLPGLCVPEEYGGSGADALTQVIAFEELARVCASTCLAMMITKLGALPIASFGTDEQRQRWLPRIATGESQVSYCQSEPDAGSDVAAMTTRAVRDGDDYVISGTKSWITNAGISDLYTVFAKTDPSAGHRGMTAFVVEAERGVQVTKLEDKLGIRGSPTGEVLFDDVRVPAANRLGEEGEGFYIAMHTLDRSRPTAAAQAIGIAQGALDYAVAYMKERRAFGRTLADFQGLQFMAADAAMRIEAARLLAHKACALIDEGDTSGEITRLGAMAKCFAADMAMQVTTDAVQFLGGYGYTRDFPVERMMRDAKITQIYEGTSQIQRVVIARHLFQHGGGGGR